MFADEIAARRLKTLVDHYMETRKRRHDVVSTSRAETAIRYVLPNCPVSGKALDDMIAACAVEHGLGVLFDRSEITDSVS
ncbi:MAG: hypothetical protein E5Y61_21745 [Mesorhizobium sp.]|nr:MAG: hypothetical protein E5Y61_21745 [Mesorhizobium sp.]TIM70760.1 MAG: hypothetical protein E5Y60_13675 [Mesorhizobium sp.]